MIEASRLGQYAVDSKFSILIPSWNNLELLKLCIKSIKSHSSFNHQIIIHINEGSDGSLEWTKTQNDISFTYSKKNIGVCYALNAMRALVKTEYMVFVNDDMYLLPEWDKFFLEEINNAPNQLFFFSGTSL